MILSLLACDAAVEEVTMFGTTYDAPNAEGAILPGVTLHGLLDNGSTELSSTTSDDDGIFYLTLPAGAAFFVSVEKEGYVPTAFSGTAGITDFYSGYGLPWTVSEAWVATTRATWAACEGADEGSFVIGEARLPVPGVEDTLSLPLAPDVNVSFTQSDGSVGLACYLDEGGVADASAESTSALGAWAVFGVVPGPGLLEVTIPTESGTVSEIYKVLVPEGGLAGLYPVLTPES